jgi:hypothetical protein
MVMDEEKHREKTPARQAFQDTHSQPNKIGPSTPFEFNGKNLTAYGGLLPVATMLERLGFKELVENTITCSRETRESLYCLYRYSCFRHGMATVELQCAHRQAPNTA